MMNSERAKKILIAFYAGHNPEKLGEIDKLLYKYKGQETVLLNSIFQKYNIDEKARKIYLNQQDPTVEITTLDHPTNKEPYFDKRFIIAIVITIVFIIIATATVYKCGGIRNW